MRSQTKADIFFVPTITPVHTPANVIDYLSAAGLYEQGREKPDVPSAED